jgi:hypothetical protein
MGMYARSFVSSKFDNNKQINNLIKVYEETIKRFKEGKSNYS